MTVTILDKVGARYEAPDAGAADKAVASGLFTLAAPEAAPGMGEIAAPPAVPAPGVASVAAGPAGTPPAPVAVGGPALSPGDDLDAYAVQHGKLSPAAVAGNPEARLALPAVKPTQIIDEKGDVYEAPDEAKASEAVASGLFKRPTPNELLDAQDRAAGVAAIETGGGTGLKSVIGGAADAALTGALVHNPLGQLASAVAPKGLQRVQEATLNQVSEAEPVVYGAGAVGGEVASALGVGAVASGLTGAAGLTGVARAAAEGAIFSAEPVAKAIVNRDPAGSAEALALGVGLNIALHGAFGAIEKLPGAAAEGVESVQNGVGQAIRDRLVPELSTDEAGNFFGRKIGLTTKQIADNRDQIVPAIKAAGILSSDTAEAAVAKIQKLEESGPAIGRAIKALDGFDGKAPIIEDHLANATTELRKMIPQEALDREAVEAAYESGKKELRRIALSDKPNPIRLGLARNQLETAERALLDMPKLSPLAEQALKTIGPIVKQVEASSARGTFEATQALKKFVGDQTNFADNKFANTLRKQAYGVVAENTARAEDAAASELGSAAVVEGLRQQRGAYALHKLFGDAADKVAARAGPEHLGHLLGGPATGSGHMLPHFVLSAFGLPSGINAALAVIGVPQIVKHYIAKQQLRGAIAKLLGESAAPTTNTLLHAIDRQKLELSGAVKSFFGSLGTREAEKALDTSGGLRGFVPEANGRSHAQQLASVQQLVTQAQTDPAATAARLEHVVGPLRAEGLHEVAQAYTDHQLRLLKVLQAILPNDPNSIAKAHPFAARVTEDDVSPATRARYQRALTVAADPTALLTLIRNNQISAADVAVAAAVNPSTLQKLRDEVIAEGMRTKPDLTYQQRLSMGILLGQHIDQSTEQIPQMQAAYAVAPAPAHVGAAHKFSAGARNNLAGAPLTLSQHGAGHSS